MRRFASRAAAVSTRFLTTTFIVPIEPSSLALVGLSALGLRNHSK
jgi:hypothetical protein